MNEPQPDDGSERPAASGLAVSPFCVHLQSKKLWFASGPPLEESDYLDASCRCWCRRTMQILGPDKERAQPSDCRAGRTCFEGIL